ncbi:DNA polymerase Y family protein [Agrobacterium sp. a22-2]|uniref:Y-family DNA polymerase n=1 Tax=Agrobacterium sp. a22-2 TaxID=2283840 RepID=UPI001446FFB2|nr:DNA polymerase Y family protein [Agrobacterium sp. a22-2]NKN34894.1 DNA polymerase Y family protein [Agrobacterium sp. a22-2]
MSPRNPQRILSIAFPHLATDRIARQTWGPFWISDGRPDGPPIVVTAMVHNAIRIVAHEADAARFGIFRNQPLGDARALVPGLDCHEHDPDALRALLHALAEWCGRYTPLVAIDGTGDGLLMDVTGCCHLFGGEAALVADVSARLTAQGFTIRLCLADTAGAAFAMARFGTRSVLAPGEQADALLPLPVSALRLEDGVATGLRRVGLKTIGCIAGLPRAPLAARFGRPLLTRLDQAMGQLDEVISPLLPVAELAAEKRFAEPVVYEDDILATIAHLAGTLAEPLEKRGLGARQCCLRLFRADGKVSSLSVLASQPVRDPARILRLFKDRITGLHDDLDAGFGFDVIRLEITRADPFDARQADFVAGKASGEDYAALVDRIGARLGPAAIRQFSLADTHIPERSFTTHAAVQGRTIEGRGRDEPGFAPGEDAPSPTRPLILFNRPEPMEAMAEVPDGPPLRFRWRRASYEVARSEGPERIACEWWREGRGAYSRDYFRVEDVQGYRFWVFRHGLYERETAGPKWYMHGLFA